MYHTCTFNNIQSCILYMYIIYNHVHVWNDPHVVISGYRKYYKYYNNKVELLYIVENGQRKEKGREWR